MNGNNAVFDISSTVAVSNPACFGVNLDPPAMSHWSTEPWHNQWWLMPNPNPVTARVKGFASGGSATTLEDEGIVSTSGDGGLRGLAKSLLSKNRVRSGGPLLGYFDVFRTGFFDGGTVAVYRFRNNALTLVREERIATFEASPRGPNKLTFVKPGPAVEAGDVYVLTTSRTDFPTGITRTWTENPWWLCYGLQLGNNARSLYDSGVRLSLDKDVPPHGGNASFALTVPQGWSDGRVSLGNWFISGERKDDPRLHEGKTYTLRLWMKQLGMRSGVVDVKIATMASPEFHVDGQWKEYSADFTASPPPRDSAERLDIGTSESGKLLIDNITVTEKEGPPPYGFYPEITDSLRRFHPGTLRIWTLQQNNGFGKCLDDVLGPPEGSNLTFQVTDGATTTVPVGLHQMLSLCEQIGSDPWIITSVMFSAREQENLIEYLAGSADSPYGRKRAQWGHPKPWTDSFRRIKLEMGNETWNGMFQPQGFPAQGALYGAYSEFMFRRMKGSPWFHAEKFQFVINGWGAQPSTESWSFGAAALRAAPSAQAIDIAYYTGGWDAVGILKADNPDEGWLNILTYSQRLLHPLSLQFKRTADIIAAEQGRPGVIQSLVYEAGPGYTLPGPGKFNLREQQEGKSLGQAVNTLGIFMDNLRNSYGDQCFFTFQNGHYWASHNRTWGEHLAWKALGMRNTLLKGDLLIATAKSMVSIDLPETRADLASQSNSADTTVKTFPASPALPLVDCYPFRQGNNYSFMILSRRLNGPTSITLNLPYDPKTEYMIHTLSASDPLTNNIDRENVAVVTEKKTGFARSFTLSIPPHSVIVLENSSR